MKFKIENKSSVLFEGEYNTLKDCVVDAVKSGANLRGADLHGADLSDANLSDADLRGAKNSELAFSMTVIVNQGEIFGWKKCIGDVIVKLRIPAEAKRSNGTGRKCRAEYAWVEEISGGLKTASSSRGGTYVLGEKFTPDSWDNNRFNECSNGVHFFVTKEEAEAHVLLFYEIL